MNIFKTIIAAVMLSSAAALQIESRLGQARRKCIEGCGVYECSADGKWCNSGWDMGKGQ